MLIVLILIELRAFVNYIPQIFQKAESTKAGSISDGMPETMGESGKAVFSVDISCVSL